jgi:putative exporter of polyketide antibiotics
MDLVCNKETYIEYLFGIKLVLLDDISNIFEQSNNSLNDNKKGYFLFKNTNVKNDINRLFLIIFIIGCFVITIFVEYLINKISNREKKDDKKNFKELRNE